MASIRTAGLTKNFGDLRAVNEIDLDLPEGLVRLCRLNLGSAMDTTEPACPDESQAPMRSDHQCKR
jgi:hypothetical protein